MWIIRNVVEIADITRIVLPDEVMQSGEGRGQMSLCAHIELWRGDKYAKMPFQNSKNSLNNVAS